jgi:uncharacterized protein (DUF488 family)
MTAYTIGHSTHALETLVELLHSHGLEVLCDVRRAPRSRRAPQFAREALEESLPAAGLAYLRLPELGGWRSPVTGRDENAGWSNRSFRGYADHMSTPEFAAGLGRLIEVARERPAAVMCAEAAWWRCHRRLIADALVAGGWEVLHIGPDGRLSSHELTEFAVIGDDGGLVYPPGGAEQLVL